MNLRSGAYYKSGAKSVSEKESIGRLSTEESVNQSEKLETIPEENLDTSSKANMSSFSTSYSAGGSGIAYYMPLLYLGMNDYGAHMYRDPLNIRL